mgnify:FL=1
MNCDREDYVMTSAGFIPIWNNKDAPVIFPEEEAELRRLGELDRAEDVAIEAYEKSGSNQFGK